MATRGEQHRHQHRHAMHRQAHNDQKGSTVLQSQQLRLSPAPTATYQVVRYAAGLGKRTVRGVTSAKTLAPTVPTWIESHVAGPTWTCLKDYLAPSVLQPQHRWMALQPVDGSGRSMPCGA